MSTVERLLTVHCAWGGAFVLARRVDGGGCVRPRPAEREGRSARNASLWRGRRLITCAQFLPCRCTRLVRTRRRTAASIPSPCKASRAQLRPHNRLRRQRRRRPWSSGRQMARFRPQSTAPTPLCLRSVAAKFRTVVRAVRRPYPPTLLTLNVFCALDGCASHSHKSPRENKDCADPTRPAGR